MDAHRQSWPLPARSYETHVDASTAVQPVLAGDVASAGGVRVRSSGRGRSRGGLTQRGGRTQQRGRGRGSGQQQQQQRSSGDAVATNLADEMSEVLYRAGELIYVRPLSGGMWVA